METLLDTVTKQLQIQIPVLRKYVDDLFLVLPTDSVEKVREVFNSYHPKIQFTVEVEEEGKLPFLDLLLVRQPDQSIKTEWYQKPIASGRFVNYFSSQSLQIKINTAKNFIHRVKSFSTNVPPQTVNEVIHKQLSLNNYPKSLINRLINTTNTNKKIEKDLTNIKYRSMVNIENLTSTIKNQLKTDYQNIKISVTQPFTLRNILPKVKDPVPKDQRSNVIYCIPCKGNPENDIICQSCYVGQTTRFLKDRLNQHRYNINSLHKIMENGKETMETDINKMREKSALVDHHFVNNHEFDFAEAEILDSTNKIQNLNVLEMCHIINTPHTINIRKDTEKLSATYAGVLHTLTHTTKSSKRAKLQKQQRENNQNKNNRIDTSSAPFPDSEQTSRPPPNSTPWPILCADDDLLHTK